LRIRRQYNDIAKPGRREIQLGPTARGLAYEQTCCYRSELMNWGTLSSANARLDKIRSILLNGPLKPRSRFDSANQKQRWVIGPKRLICKRLRRNGKKPSWIHQGFNDSIASSRMCTGLTRSGYVVLDLRSLRIAQQGTSSTFAVYPQGCFTGEIVHPPAHEKMPAQILTARFPA